MTDRVVLCDNYRPGWFLVYPAEAAGISGLLIRVSGELVSPGISKKYNGP